VRPACHQERPAHRERGRLALAHSAAFNFSATPAPGLNRRGIIPGSITNTGASHTLIHCRIQANGEARPQHHPRDRVGSGVRKSGTKWREPFEAASLQPTNVAAARAGPDQAETCFDVPVRITRVWNSIPGERTTAAPVRRCPRASSIALSEPLSIHSRSPHAPRQFSFFCSTVYA